METDSSDSIALFRTFPFEKNTYLQRFSYFKMISIIETVLSGGFFLSRWLSINRNDHLISFRIDFDRRNKFVQISISLLKNFDRRNGSSSSILYSQNDSSRQHCFIWLNSFIPDNLHRWKSSFNWMFDLPMVETIGNDVFDSFSLFPAFSIHETDLFDRFDLFWLISDIGSDFSNTISLIERFFIDENAHLHPFSHVKMIAHMGIVFFNTFFSFDHFQRTELTISFHFLFLEWFQSSLLSHPTSFLSSELVLYRKINFQTGRLFSKWLQSSRQIHLIQFLSLEQFRSAKVMVLHRPWGSTY